jgi:dipeptidyl-peptidase-4
MHHFRLLFMAALFAVLTPAASEELTIERIYGSPELAGPTLRGAQFSPDGRRVTYLKGRTDRINVFDLWELDVASGKHRLLVDSTRLAPVDTALSTEEEARRERQRIASLRGIVEYYWAPDSRGLLFPLGGDLYYYDLKAPPDTAVRRLTDTEQYETDVRFSPKGRYVSFVRDQDLFVIELATGHERALTTDGEGLVSNGVAEFIAQEEMGRHTGYWWSPDERHIAATRVDESPVPEYDRFEVYATEFKVWKQRYPAAGTSNALVTLGVIDVATGTRTPLDLGPNSDIYLARVDWYPESDRLLVQRQSRDQKSLDLLSYPATGGTPTKLFSETSDVWVDLHDDLRFVPGKRQFIWSSQRTGHRHLYLYDYDGKLVRPVTAGEWDAWMVPNGRGVDAGRGLVYFIGSERSSIERHLYVAALDTKTPSAPKRITMDGDGWNDVSMSQDAQRFLRAYSDPGQPTRWSLHDASGKRLAWLVENRLDSTHPYAPYLPKHVLPEFGQLRAADGTVLDWQMHRPAVLEPGRKYPAIVYVYGGPHAQMVMKRFGGRRDGFVIQKLVQDGYVVFTLDNRGSGQRGHRFESQLHGQFGRVEVEDQLRGVEYLKSLPYVDADRIGVFGWSYGGYMTLMLMAKGNGAFRAGVAGAPVTDWRLYDTHYTERYIGDPRTNAAAYEASGVFPYLKELRGSLLVMHGMADDNVLFTNSTKLFKALVDAGIQFDALPYPGSKHAALSFPDTGVHGWKTIFRFFDQNLRED